MTMLRMEVAGEAIVSRAIGRFAGVTSDLRPAWRDIADDFLKVEERQFESAGAQGTGGAWQPLSPAYAAWKARNYPGMPIMQRSQRLFRSLSERNADHIEESRPDELVLGTRVPYAGYHQVGAGALPQRRVIALNDTIRRRWMKFIQRYLVEEAKRQGLLEY